jgi:hypothetical protein
LNDVNLRKTVADKNQDAWVVSFASGLAEDFVNRKKVDTKDGISKGFKEY